MSKFPTISCSTDSVVQPISVNMKRYKLIFCDLDGTLIETVSGRTFPKGIWDCKPRIDVWDALKKCNPETIVIVTNQGGVEKGFVRKRSCDAKIEYINCCLGDYTGAAVFNQVCYSNDPDNINRKPNTGMLRSAIIKQYGHGSNYDKYDCLMIGDASGLPGQFSDSDKKTAENFGCDYMDVNEFVKSINGYHL